MALIVKTRADGVVKRRLIVDLRRSGVNAKATAPERIVLPRIQDAVLSALNVIDLHQASPLSLTDDDNRVEMISADCSDAYMHFQ
eukprot:7074536-Heterocapsa_arctica.AAC.1